jgi:aminopeptidase-like protein
LRTAAGTAGGGGSVGGRIDASLGDLALFWVLNLSDGGHCCRRGRALGAPEFGAIRAAADELLEHDLPREAA